MRFLANLFSWILGLIVLCALGLDAFSDKLQTPAGQNIVFSTLASRSGFAIFEPSLRFLYGVFELIAAICILVPALRAFGARLAMILLALALGAHLSPYLGIVVPTIVEGPADDGGTLFHYTCMGLGITLLLILCESWRRETSEPDPV